MTEGYNGWRNYETWSVALIIDNDEGLHHERRAIVADAICNGEGSEYWTEDQRRRYRVAEALKDWVERVSEFDMEPLSADPYRRPWSYLWTQLIGAALSEVDWDEIASHYVQEYEEELEPAEAK